MLYLTENPVVPGSYLNIDLFTGEISHWTLLSELPAGLVNCTECGQPNTEIGYVRGLGTACAHRSCVRITQAVEI